MVAPTGGTGNNIGRRRELRRGEAEGTGVDFHPLDRLLVVLAHRFVLQLKPLKPTVLENLHLAVTQKTELARHVLGVVVILAGAIDDQRFFTRQFRGRGNVLGVRQVHSAGNVLLFPDGRSRRVDNHDVLGMFVDMLFQLLRRHEIGDVDIILDAFAVDESSFLQSWANPEAGARRPSSNTGASNA